MSEKPTYDELEQRVQKLETILKERSLSDAALTSLPGVFYVYDEHGKILRWNRNLESVSGYSGDEITQMLPEEFLPKEKRVNVNEIIKRAIDKGHHSVEVDIMSKDGSTAPYLFTSSRFEVNGIFYHAGVGVNNAERSRSEKVLKKSENKYRILFNNAPIGLYRATFDGELISVNSAAVQMFGYNTKNELLKTPVVNLYANSKEKNKFIDRLNEKGEVYDYELLLKKENGENFWGLVSTVISKNKKENVSYYDGFIHDITETKRLQDQLRQAQKMEALGTLAGGIAHDFNNILGGILGYAQLAQLNSGENPKIKNYIDHLCLAGERAKDLVQQILAFSRQTTSERAPVDIGIIITETLNLLKASIPSTIEISYNVKSHLGTVEADKTQIHQIMMNLCTNAAHAMEKEGGKLNIVLIPVQLTVGESTNYMDIKPGKYLKLTVSDTGHGMEADKLARIFEPYYTTKEVGKGTGMGLATVHGIVKELKGDIKVYSEPDIGTSFHILLPLIEVHADKTVETSDLLPKGNEQILFVDDEKLLIDIGKNLLESLGYQVETRTSSYDALEAFRVQPNKYDMVITDMTMPKMTGEKLAEEVKKIHPNIPIILCTGFNKRITSEMALKLGFSSILMKPIPLHDLAKTVRKVLDDAKGIAFNA